VTVGFFLAVAEVAATIERPALERSVLRNVEANSLAVLRTVVFFLSTKEESGAREQQSVFGGAVWTEVAGQRRARKEGPGGAIGGGFPESLRPGYQGIGVPDKVTTNKEQSDYWKGRWVYASFIKCPDTW
jgi:hypothetical protein